MVSMVSIMMTIMGFIEKLFLSKFITTPLSKTLYVHYKHEMLSYSEIDDSPAPK